MKWIICFLSILFLLSCNRSSVTCDVLIKNAVIFDGEKKLHDKDCIVIKGNKILDVCDKNNVKNYAPKNIIDAKGHFVTPGFVEAHGHLMFLGKSLSEINLSSEKSWDSIVKLVGDKSKQFKKGEWIIGNGWHHEKWVSTPEKTVSDFPAHDKLSMLTPDHPVMLLHANLHTMILNQKAMDILDVKHIEYENADEVIKDKNGKFTGVFVEDAMINVKQSIDISENNIAPYQMAIEECVKHGITYFHEAATNPEEILFYRNLDQENKLPIRLNLMAYGELDTLIKNKEQLFFIEKNIRSKSIKAFADGALGSRTAWMHEPYSDDPQEHGNSRITNHELNDFATFCAKNDLQFCVHAIGDKANSQVLHIFDQHSKKNMDKRWRVEHAQHIKNEALDLFQQTGAIASVQPNHCTSDAPYAEERLGQERIKTGAYQWRTFLEHNIPLAIGTDVPVEPINPFKNIYAAVTRKPNKESTSFYPEQKLSRLEALHIYTSKNHFASFDESRLGKIDSGYLADISILDKDILDCPEDDLLDVNALYTIVNGEVVWKR